MVDLGGYVIVLVEKEGKIKLFGSAAERSDCDEILEVNGSSLEHMSHKEIIQHIHQCIKTRTICLRVKRRSLGKLGSSVDTSLIDAFVIGSRAREHFKTLTKDANITPKDIAQLSKILSENNEDNESITIKNKNELENNIKNLQSDVKINSELKKNKNKENLRKSDSGDIDYLELSDDNIELFNINTGSNIDLKKSDSQQSIVDILKKSANINLKKTSLNNDNMLKNQEDEEVKKYIHFKSLNTVVDRLEANMNDIQFEKLIEKGDFKTLIDIYSTLMQEKYLDASILGLDSLKLYQEVFELSRNENNLDGDFLKLLEILSECKGLFQVLDYTSKLRKKYSSKSDDNLTFEQENDLTKEEKVNALEDKCEKKETQSFIETNISPNDELIDKEKNKFKKAEYDKKQKESKNEICEEQFRESFQNRISEEEMKSSPKSIQNNILPSKPSLPIQMIDSFSLNCENNMPKLITSTANISSSTDLIKIPNPAESLTQQISQDFIQSQQFSPEFSIQHKAASSSQNNFQNNFLSVSNNLSLASTDNFSETPYYNLLSIHSSELNKQSIQPNLCNLHYSKSNQPIQINFFSNQPSDASVSSTYAPISTNFKLNESTTNQTLSSQEQRTMFSTKSAINTLKYSAGQIPLEPSLPNIISNLAPNLSNLPADTKLSIVKIQKHSSEPLGATVRNENDGRVTIGRIVCGGAASRCQALQEGDEILMVNNIYIRGKTVDQMCELLNQMQGTLTFVIAKRNSVQSANEQAESNSQQPTENIIRKSSTSSHDLSNMSNGGKVLHFKAFFDYNPINDIYIPCRELGLSFRKGDLLHVIDWSDECWWQSYKEGDVNQNLAGLIPSLKFQLMRDETIKKLEKQKIEKKQNENIEENNSDNKRKPTSSLILSFNCQGKKSNSKRPKNRDEEFLLSEHYVPYEEMKQSLGHKRTIVFLGPNNIGRQNLRERLLKHKKNFATAIPHTSRIKRSDEEHGKDYYFVTKSQFEQYIEEDKFVEFGDYDKNYYGTSYNSIEDVLKSNRTCILNLHAQSILKLRTPSAGKKFKPYFVFISPPSNLNSLRKLVESIKGAPISINDLHIILSEAYEIRKNFQHYFDLILTVTDIEEAYKILLNEITTFDKEPQWIPVTWC